MKQKQNKPAQGQACYMYSFWDIATIKDKTTAKKLLMQAYKMPAHKSRRHLIGYLKSILTAQN